MRLFGKNPVIERLRTNPQSIRNITLQEGFSDAAWIYKKAKQWGIAVYAVNKDKMEKLARNINSQGILVDIDDFKYARYDQVLEDAAKKKWTLLFLDGLNDPQNLGAIIRSIGCLGHFIVILPTHEAVGVTETVLRIASGGENYVQICRVSNLNNAIKEAKKMDFQIAGAVVKGGQSVETVSFPYPLGLVVGSEQDGVREIIRKQLDLMVTIPMLVDTMSFNVAHATSILCYEIAKQKHQYIARNKISESDQ